MLIAFIGSVFSPRYFQDRRRGAGDPYLHCAINVALYGAGPGYWAFTEYAQRAPQVRGDTLQLGANSLVLDQRGLTCRVEERGAPWPRRICGTIELTGPVATSAPWSLTADGVHRWQPLIPRGHVRVQLTHPRLNWQGSGYLDCNHGDAALDEGIRSWNWLRTHGEREALIVYDVVPAAGAPRSHALRFGAAALPASVPVPGAVPLAATRWRMARAVAADAGAVPEVLDTLEDTPFYARSLVRTRLEGRPVLAVHESLSLERFQRPWVRSLLPFRMRRSAR